LINGRVFYGFILLRQLLFWYRLNPGIEDSTSSCCLHLAGPIC